VEPVIIASARRHGIADEDILHAYAHPMRAFEGTSEATIVVGGDRSGRLIEVGYLEADDGRIAIIHAMNARARYLDNW
jgi:hypothetical protein